MVAEIKVSDQPRSLSEEGFLVVEQEESVFVGTNLGDSSLKENELESDELQSPGLPELDSLDDLQPGTKSSSNSTSLSLQLQKDLSKFIAKLRVLASPWAMRCSKVTNSEATISIKQTMRQSAKVQMMINLAPTKS